MKLFINYADKGYYNSQVLGCNSALRFGFNQAIPFNKGDIDPDFYSTHEKILTQPRGAGYWLWKPYIITKALDKLKDGDYLCYCDAGANFISSVDPLITTLDLYQQDLFAGELRTAAKTYTKRDVFVHNRQDTKEYTDAYMRDASFQFIKKTDFAVHFYHEYLEQCCLSHLITDEPNIYGLPNYPEFIDHRHDQSIYSILALKYRLPAFRMVSQFSNSFIPEYTNSDYPQMIDHHRRK